MAINKMTMLYLVLFMLMSVVVVKEFVDKGIILDWYFFIWLFNLNFLTYGLYNNGSIVLEASSAQRSMLVQLHHVISYLKIILIGATILIEYTNTEIPYYYIFVVIVLALDIFLLLYRSKTGSLAHHNHNNH